MADILDMYGNKINSNKPSQTTTLVNGTKDTIAETENKEDILFIQTPIFILFAEFLGFVSGFVEIADNWCKLSKPMPPKYMQTLLEREARSIYDQMLEEWSEEEIHKLYVNFYDCGLDELELDLNEKKKRNGETLII